jgi:DNA-binding response OmpR family regulator
MSEFQGREVLILEDDPAVRALLEKQLAARGFRVTVASDGLDGLEQLKTTHPDLVVCDLMMPKLDGLSFVRALKSQPTTQHIPVIFLTARTDTRSMVEGINLGASFYLTKPFQLEDLLARIRRALECS